MEDNVHSISFFDSYLKREVILRSTDTVTPGTIKMYSCGPTVYSTQHIGNMRAAWFPDTFRALCKVANWKVELVHNITDVGHLVDDGDDGEDKIEKGAKRDGKSVQEIVDYYLNDYLEQAKSLCIYLPDGKYQPKATAYIKEQMLLALILLRDEKAYLLEDGIYFDSQNNSQIVDQVNQLPGMPQTTGNHNFTDREIKNTTKNPADFAIWKFVDQNSLQKWRFVDFPEALNILETITHDKFSNFKNGDTLFSMWGCPGWHSECVAMIAKILAQTDFGTVSKSEFLIDVHSGGEEHIPVHHKNEILQSEALGYHLSKNWIHWKHVLVDGTKMSKSLGNTYTVHDLVDRGYDPLAYRLMLLEHHYSEQLNFTWDKLEQSQNRLFNLRKEVAKIRSFAQSPNLESLNDQKYEDLKHHWLDILCDDLNIPKFLDEYQEHLYATANRIQDQDIMAIHDHKILSEFASKFLKLKLFELDLPTEILNIGENRWEAKKQKNYQEADKFRQEALYQGWQIDDYRWGWGVWWRGLS
jgi:cysteinyl-tRNA synthetase